MTGADLNGGFWNRLLRWRRAALERLGGTPAGAVIVVPAETAECARVRIPMEKLRADVVLLGVAARIRVTRSGATVRLLGAAGEVLEHLYCPVRDAPYDVAAFARASEAAFLVVGHVAPDSEAVILSAHAYGFTAAALDPARLIPQRDLARVEDWPRDPYGEPALEDAAGRLRNLVFGGLTGPAVVPWLHDLRIELEPGDEQSRCLMKWGVYEAEGLFVVGQHLRPGGVFVDVGANCGIYTLFAARAVGASGRVIAFEPSAREFRRLRRNVELNNFGHVRLHEAAISDRAGVVHLRIAEAGFAGHNTIADKFAYDRVSTAAVAEVAADTLDVALAELDRLDMIKMDIEGAELQALRGAAATLARLRPAILLEVYEDALAGNGASVAEVLAWAERARYRLYLIDAASGGRTEVDAFPAGINQNVLALPIGPGGRPAGAASSAT